MEEALRSWISKTTESLKEHLRRLRPLVLGERVFLQNQQGTSPNKCYSSGIVVKSPGHGQYQVKVDGSRCLTLRNRCFLLAYSRATASINLLPMVPPSLPGTGPTPALPQSLPCRFMESGPLRRPHHPARSHSLLHLKHLHQATCP